VRDQTQNEKNKVSFFFYWKENTWNLRKETELVGLVNLTLCRSKKEL